jgi:hypothetical protein
MTRSRIIATPIYSILEVSEATFAEIETKLREAKYDHCFDDREGETIIDMAGVALQKEAL